jgi:hypothetical protein
VLEIRGVGDQPCSVACQVSPLADGEAPVSTALALHRWDESFSLYAVSLVVVVVVVVVVHVGLEWLFNPHRKAANI